MAGKPPHSAQLFEEYLVTATMAGDRRAAQRLAQRFQTRMLRTARRILGDTDLAAGAVQEAWLSILPRIARLRDPSRFAPFDFGILRRRCVDAIRSAQRGRSVFDGEDDIEAADPARQGEALALREAFAALPPDQRLAAHLFFREGLTLAEIAEVQNIPEGTAKSRLFHARRKLKTALSGDTP
ncbi:RNA polymerase sigma factor [Aurantiacibacter aquimixticola]|uniref:Sigma-70 family RNA polymerase sigma factor n=1 Tax=Aurantiacibacter aquimixticola TaxID=1958945 RepID=A0A419RQ71_9SPHN|nr:sigma-70 family RNA polymerase sigma factor [Aurantiacibacter aquimixticola]RJY07982.1 sigma-70 family RNA polymerase sigma factor [Aurantiacibacter aquimixticola]